MVHGLPILIKRYEDSIIFSWTLFNQMIIIGSIYNYFSQRLLWQLI